MATCFESHVFGAAAYQSRLTKLVSVIDRFLAAIAG